jgi:hypothetical protein
MKTPRDLSGVELAKALRKLGSVITRQSGSHLRITTQEGGEHHEVIPQSQPDKDRHAEKHSAKHCGASSDGRLGIVGAAGFLVCAHGRANH